LDTLNSLQNLARIDVALTGDWRITRHGAWTWQGEAVAEASIVGILFLSCNGRMFWAKSSLVSNQLEIMLHLHPTTWDGRTIQFMYSIGRSYNSIYDATATLRSKDYLPEIPHTRAVQTGHLFTFASFYSTPAAELYAMFLAKQDVKVMRKHIWCLRKASLTGLMPPLLEVFTHGRKGKFLI
jgi:hypothetical protein